MPELLRSQAQAQALARAAGFTVATAEIMAAIAMAETPVIRDGKQFCDFGAVGDLHLVNATYGPSYGAWQIRSVLAQSGTGTYRDPLRLQGLSPEFNAEAAYAVWRQQGFKAWSTFNSGAHLGYMLKAEHNPRPTLPPGSYMVTGGDSLSKIGTATGYPWRDLAALNRIAAPRYIINPGLVLLLPEFPYTVRAGDTLSSIAAAVGQDITWLELWSHNKSAVPNPDRISTGQKLMVPRRIPS